MAILDGTAMMRAREWPRRLLCSRAGAKFGDGAVIDAQFRTTDVFTIMPLADLEERYRDYYGGPVEMPDSYVARMVLKCKSLDLIHRSMADFFVHFMGQA